MTISKKPKLAGPQTDIDALINRGGNPGSASLDAKSGTVAIVLRVPALMLGQIDVAVKSRPIKTPRHTWILEAVYEKLTRETEAP